MRFDVRKLVRKNCAGFAPYVAGKPIETLKRELGLKSVIKLASNENPLGPSPAAVRAVRASAAKAFFYPDANSWDLKQALAKKYAVDPAAIMVGAGSDELIEMVAKVFCDPGDDIVVSKHAFIRYAMAGKLMGCRVIDVPMRPGLTHDLPAMGRAVTRRTKAVFIANPNNPTGTYTPRRELERFLAALRPGAGGSLPLVVVDEAYYEYACTLPDYPDTLRLLKRYPNLVVLRTFSKIYGLAGLRVGYGFSSPAVVDYIDRVRPPFNINLPAQVAAVASLADRGQVTRSRALMARQMPVLCTGLARLGVPYIPSAGNFVLFDIAPRRGADVFKALLREGVIVRAMDEYALPTQVRVTVGKPAENRRFLAALKKVLGR